MVMVRGKFERDEETSRLVAAELTLLEAVRERAVREVEITLPGSKMGKDAMRRLADVLERHPGDRRVSFIVRVNGDGTPLRVRAATARRIRPSDTFVRDVEALCGAGSVLLK
jgi:DNA polymerase-3 subunit alpha